VVLVHLIKDLTEQTEQLLKPLVAVVEQLK
jgi:hypothetical protein